MQTQPYEVQKDMSWPAALPLFRETEVRIRMDLLTWPHRRSSCGVIFAGKTLMIGVGNENM